MNYEMMTVFDENFSSSNFFPENYLASSADVGSNYAQEVLDLVNMYRSQAGVPSLTLSETLMQGANTRANELTTYYSHTRPNGTSCTTVVQDTYPSTYLGENIAVGQDSVEEVVTAWMNSTGHRENILRPSYTELGVGFVYDSDSYYRYHWVQLFGNPYLAPNDSSKGFTYFVGSDSQHTLKVGNEFNGEVWAEYLSDFYYVNAVDALDNPNSLILAGNTGSNIIYDGTGNSSLWGGNGNVDDTLVGGDGAEMFWYGKYDGYDVITGADSSDVVNLYDVDLSEITEANVSAGQVVLRFNTGTALVIQDSAQVTPTFQLGGGGIYKYDRRSGQWY